MVKNPPATVGNSSDADSTPGWGRSPRITTRSSILAWKTLWIQGAWRAAVHGVPKSWTGLNHWAHTSTNVSHRWVGLAGSAAGSIHGRVSVWEEAEEQPWETGGAPVHAHFLLQYQGKGNYLSSKSRYFNISSRCLRKTNLLYSPVVINPSPQISWLPKISRCFSFTIFR